jgi:nitrite reductase (NADH) large subunit
MESLVIIGNGMAGVACLENILSHKKKFDITIYGDETHANYNRILLSSVLAGERTADEITINGIEWYQKNSIGLRLGVRIIDVNTTLRTITGDDGSVTRYDKLIFATGSSPFLPPMDGLYRRNVFTFRSLDDTHGMMRVAGPGKRAVVIGGGLLGLEAARGLQLQGCEVTVIHIVDTLMNNQLDSTAGDFVKRKMEEIGIHVIGGQRTTAILGSDEVEAIEFSDGERLPADLVVIAAGIRPNAELARKAGIECGRGIIVNDFMETSDPCVFAVGECTEHRGEVFGLVAPLFEQGKVLAATITGNKEPKFEGWKPAAKLKVMGVDVFSAGEFLESAGTDVVRYEDQATGVYKKLLVRENRLVGCVLVGDAADSNRYMDWLRTNADLVVRRRNLLFPDPVEDKGESIAELPDSETICGCMGVTKGKVIQAIHENGIRTMSQLKECTRASTGCGSCSGVCEGLLKAVSPDFEEDTRRVLCKCVPYTQDNLREIIQSQKIKRVQEVLDIYGNGKGCEICKPALSYLVDVVWCGDHDEDRSARFINDRVHANIQNDGTFSVVPRMRGGVTTPDELRRIADVADKYKVPLVKVTGSQRIDLLGIRKADLPKVWADLGMPSGQAYAKGLRMVKTCVGTEFCRFGVQDAMATGIELERRLENLFTPHKTKLGVTGCPRNCAEVTVKDIGLVGQDGSWQVVVGGAAGKHVRKADLLITVETTEEALDAAMLFFQYYRENGHYLERTYDFVERLGMEKIRKDTVYAQAKEKKALLRRLQKSKALSSDAWLERKQPVNPTQFVQIQPMQIPLTAVENREVVLQ